MNQACEELPPFPKIPEEGEEERKLYFIAGRLQTVLLLRCSSSLLFLIWDFRIYLMSTYAALRASCVRETDHFLHFLLSHYAFLPVGKSSDLVYIKIIFVHANRITLQDVVIGWQWPLCGWSVEMRSKSLFSPTSDWLGHYRVKIHPHHCTSNVTSPATAGNLLLPSWLHLCSD